MPHRTTYFFPRQFPDRRINDESKQQQIEDREKLINKLNTTNANTNSNNSLNALEPLINNNKGTASDHEVIFSATTRTKFPALSEFFANKSKKLHHHHHRRRRQQVFDEWLPEQDHVLPPPPPEASSGSSYAGSLFSGAKEHSGLSTISSETAAATATEEGSLAQRSKESYMLQLSLARRLGSQACLAGEPNLMMQLTAPDTSDVHTVSYRLWVSPPLPLFEFVAICFFIHLFHRHVVLY